MKAELEVAGETVCFVTGFVQLTLLAGSDIVFYILRQSRPVDLFGDGVHRFVDA